jgi:hypothetical protein
MKCGGNAYRDFNPFCEHVFAPPPAVFEVVLNGECVYEAYAGVVIYTHPLKEQAIALAEAHLEKKVVEQFVAPQAAAQSAGSLYLRWLTVMQDPSGILFVYRALEKRGVHRFESAGWSNERCAEELAHAGVEPPMSRSDREAAANEEHQAALASAKYNERYVGWLFVVKNADKSIRRLAITELTRHAYTIEEIVRWSLFKRASKLAQLGLDPPKV